MSCGFVHILRSMQYGPLVVQNINFWLFLQATKLKIFQFYGQKNIFHICENKIPLLVMQQLYHVL